MKLLTGLLLVAFTLCSVQSQEDTLMSVQDELGHTHIFFETIMGLNRGQLSAYIYRISRNAVNSHLDSFQTIAMAGQEARDHINSLQPNNDVEEACLNRWKNRFELQTQRIGQRLARCAGTVQSQLVEWNNFANDIHRRAQFKAAQVQNLGFNLFAGTRLFDGPEDFPAMIKADLRDRIFIALGLTDEVTDFIADISMRIDEIEAELEECDRDVERDATREINLEISGAEACVGGGSPIDPTPTSLIK